MKNLSALRMLLKFIAFDDVRGNVGLIDDKGIITSGEFGGNYYLARGNLVLLMI